jgi:hypothetical protein
MKENQVIIKGECNVQEGCGIIVEGGGQIDYITVFKNDGTLVYKHTEAEETTFINNLLYGVYLVVVNMKNGKLYTDIVNITS